MVSAGSDPQHGPRPGEPFTYVDAHKSGIRLGEVPPFGGADNRQDGAVTAVVFKELPTMLDQATIDVRVVSKDIIAKGVVELRLRRPDGQLLPEWLPGAHIDIVLNEVLVRQYSLCGDPGDTSTYAVAVLRDDAGRGGSRLIHDGIHAGDTLSISAPRNHFDLVDGDRYVFVAGGIGITPIIPMIAAADARGAQWQLLYGGRTRGSMGYRDSLEQTHPAHVTVWPQDERGLLDLESLVSAITAPTSVYCCGPEPLLRAVEEACAGQPYIDLHIERFAPKAIENTAPAGVFEVELSSSGQVLTVGTDDKIIDILEDAGVAVSGSCYEGTCGSCETAVLAGVPDHRDSVLTDEEQSSGTKMMVCVSRARSKRLVLDL